MSVAIAIGLTLAGLFLFNMTVNERLAKTTSEVTELREIYLPVVEDMGFTNTWQDGDFLYIQVIGVKKRMCSPPQKIEALSATDFSETYHVDFMNDIRADGTFREPKEMPLTTPGKLSTFGVWRLKPIPKSAFWFSVVHNCGGRLITTNFILKDYTNRGD
jgi:hypothetical protein